MVVLFRVLPQSSPSRWKVSGADFPFGVDPSLISPLDFDTRTTDTPLLSRYLIGALLGNDRSFLPLWVGGQRARAWKSLTKGRRLHANHPFFRVFCPSAGREKDLLMCFASVIKNHFLTYNRHIWRKAASYRMYSKAKFTFSGGHSGPKGLTKGGGKLWRSPLVTFGPKGRLIFGII